MHSSPLGGLFLWTSWTFWRTFYFCNSSVLPVEMFLQVWVIVPLRIQRTKYTHYTVVKLLFSQLTFLLVEKQWGPHTVNFNFKIWGPVTSTLLFWGFFASDLYTVSLLSCFSRLSFVSDLHTVNLRIFCSPCWDVSPGWVLPVEMFLQVWVASDLFTVNFEDFEWPLHCKLWGFWNQMYLDYLFSWLRWRFGGEEPRC